MHELETPTHIFFWNGEFSNWYSSMCRFRYKGITFYNSEQCFMWEKAIYFHDMEMAERIVRTPEPSEAKALGRLVKNFDADAWSEVSYDIMVSIVFEKFNQNHMLKRVLLESENKVLVEASPYDVIWGIGLHYTNEKCLDEANWKGLNLLGKALMEVRDKIRNK